MLACVISVGVHTWRPEVVAPRRYRMVEVFAERVLPFLASRR